MDQVKAEEETFLLPTVNRLFYNLSLLKSFDMQKQSARAVLLKQGFLWISCKFLGSNLCVGVLLITLQSGFVEIVLPHSCSSVAFLHISR